MADDNTSKHDAEPTTPDSSAAGEVKDIKGNDSGEDSKKPTMDIKVYAPFKVYFEGKAYSLSALNESGPFDVLPRHYNFLCMLLPCDMKIQTPYDTKTIKIGRALMHVRSGKVTVFVDV